MPGIIPAGQPTYAIVVTHQPKDIIIFLIILHYRVEAYSKHGITAGSSLATRTVISQKLVNYLEDFWVDMVLQSDSQLTSCAATTQFPADFQFNLSHIITYFVTRCACDHQPTQGYKIYEQISQVFV